MKEAKAAAEKGSCDARPECCPMPQRRPGSRPDSFMPTRWPRAMERSCPRETEKGSRRTWKTCSTMTLARQKGR